MGLKIKEREFQEDLSVEELGELMQYTNRKWLMEKPKERFIELAVFFEGLRITGPEISGKTSSKGLLGLMKEYLDTFLASTDL